MADENWNIGDVVELKSGGPPMTVASRGNAPDSGINCVWFVEHKEEKRANFPQAALKRAEAGSY